MPSKKRQKAYFSKRSVSDTLMYHLYNGLTEFDDSFHGDRYFHSPYFDTKFYGLWKYAIWGIIGCKFRIFNAAVTLLKCTVGQINEFARIRDCWTEKAYLVQIPMESCYWIVLYRWFNNNLLFLFANVPDTSFLSNCLGLSRTHLFGRLYETVGHIPKCYFAFPTVPYL